MTDFITTSNIMFVIGILGTAFGVYNYVHTPQEKLDKRQAVIEKEVDGKAELLAKQVQWVKEDNDRRFKEIADASATAMNLAQNHVHSIDVKVDNLTVMVNSMNIEIGKLSTIIDERVPKKQ